MIEDWDTAYQQRPYVEKNPHEGLVRLMAKLDRPTTSQILDLGCGDGRHLIFLAQQGYTPIGIDQAIWGLRRSKQWVEKERLKTKLVCGQVSSLPLSSESIDAVISIQVIHHQYLSGIQRAISEVQRILRNNGIFYFTVPRYPPSGWKNMRYEQVEPQTYIPLEGFEKNIPHYFFKEEDLRSMLKGFEILEVGDDNARHFAVRAQKGMA
jgi:ubiquinone/menaquinone biosynthesis C-methylase UbiE